MNARSLAVIALAALAGACARAGKAPEAASSARRALLDGASYYEKGDFALADRSWEDCLAQAEPESGDAAECRRRLERMLEERSRATAVVAYRAPEIAEAKPQGNDSKSAMQAYLEGVVYYQNGDAARAKERWTRCTELAGGDRPTGDDCRNGLDKLALDASTGLDGKK